MNMSNVYIPVGMPMDEQVIDEAVRCATAFDDLAGWIETSGHNNVRAEIRRMVAEVYPSVSARELDCALGLL